MTTNRQYNSSVFSLLFGNETAARELYEALQGVKLPPDTPVVINTLEGVLYMTLLNDLAFLLDHKLILLIEHQSTINPNMALRLFMYLGRVYEKIITNKDIYTTRLLPIPRPECYVLYNGPAPYPDQNVLRLSDAYMDAAALGVPGSQPPALDLTVKVYNINAGHNQGIVERSALLREYSAFIGKARELGAGRGDTVREEALREAIKWCIEHDTLKDFLNQHGSEVMNMLMTEWKLEDALEVRGREEREQGWQAGWEKGQKAGWNKGRKEERTEIIKLLRAGYSLEELEKKLSLQNE